jgi:hypothetical protein
MPYPDLLGGRFGRFVVIERDRARVGGTFWLCRCDCGAERSAGALNLLRGRHQSCGCARRQPHHRYRSTPAWLSHIAIGDGCWEWRGQIEKRGGYGAISETGPDGKRRTMIAHRVVYARLVGPIPEGLVLDHVCHNNDLTCPGGPTCRHRRCVNPDHLAPAGIAQNAMRSHSAAPVRKARQATCHRGHPLAGANLYRKANGNRACKSCQRIWARNYRERRAAAR